MRKILLITLFTPNLGNRLQHYALKEKLTASDYEVQSVRFVPTNRFLLSLKYLMKRILTIFRIKQYYDHLYRKRNLIFDYFSNTYISNYYRIKGFDFESLNNNQFDYYVTGSDQVWHNWNKCKEELDFFYLDFVPRNKRIAYAASFGFTTFPEADISNHTHGLMGFEENKISIREQHGADLIKKITGFDTPVVPDPTLLLLRDDWEKIAKKPEYYVPDHFILQYFLGDEHKYTINLDAIKINSVNNELWFTKTGPSEFIWLIQHCDYVCTDSFHACVFSIIFHKDFAIFHRKQNGMEGMFDRIETLLYNTGLEQCIDNSDNHIIDWNRVDAEIENRRKVGIDFLKKALGDDIIK